MFNMDIIKDLLNKYFDKKNNILESYESLIKFCDEIKKLNINMEYDIYNKIISSNKDLYNSLDKIINDKNILNDLIQSKNNYAISFIEVFATMKNINIYDSIEYEDTREYYNESDIQYYINEIRNYKLLTKEETYELVKKYKYNNDLEAKKILIESNLRFVFYIAKRYSKYTNNFLDMIQEGTIGLITAIERFDLSLDYSLTNYAFWWIRQAIVKNIHESNRNIKIPIYLYNKIYKMNNICDNFYKSYGYEISKEELRKILSVSNKEIDILIQYRADTISLNTPVYIEDEENITIEDTLVDNNDTPEEKIINDYELEQLKEIFKLAKLTNNEIKVMYLRYGLIDNEKHTLLQIGKILNITRQRVEQIEFVALEKLKNFIKNNKDINKEKITLQNYIEIYDEEIINNVISKLTEEETMLLVRAFGLEYNNVFKNELNKIDKIQLFNVLLPKIKKLALLELSLKKEIKENNIIKKLSFL